MLQDFWLRSTNMVYICNLSKYLLTLTTILDEHEMNLSFLKILLFCLINEINRNGFHISRIFITMVVPFSIDNEPVYCMTAVVIFIAQHKQLEIKGTCAVVWLQSIFGHNHPRPFIPKCMVYALLILFGGKNICLTNNLS